MMQKDPKKKKKSKFFFTKKKKKGLLPDSVLFRILRGEGVIPSVRQRRRQCLGPEGASCSSIPFTCPTAAFSGLLPAPRCSRAIAEIASEASAVNPFVPLQPSLQLLEHISLNIPYCSVDDCAQLFRSYWGCT